ncbi:M15 family metallopeptidase [Mycobacterium sp. SMC-4]|uniref:M15 family metallopeptidase n=1 Tax=Mycobacterium sp. SMC-4 TaxID=2857059 RepID=UPI003D04E891
MTLLRLCLGTALTAALVQCAPPPEPGPTEPTVPPAEPTAQALPPETVRTVAPPPRPQPASVHPVTAADLASTWRPGCPLPPEQLRRVELNHVGFDGQPHRGVLVVHEDLTAEVIAVFEELFRLDFPIEKMRTADHYPNADDELSMRDNNTSAFNCRDIPGTGNWSLHAYGRAIDINPKLNPYIDRRGTHEPANSGPWVDRTRTDPGMLHDGDPAVRTFTDRGWQWGGHWTTPLDYQHFEWK